MEKNWTLAVINVLLGMVGMFLVYVARVDAKSLAVAATVAFNVLVILVMNSRRKQYTKCVEDGECLSTMAPFVVSLIGTVMCVLYLWGNLGRLVLLIFKQSGVL